ncbi:lysoplasmalogenase [Actinomycetaceae bacterium TAE3-ERU4]|nr:lysoplasmalogenase [Actinomycetaceae bacterium TAE3-ERU4]
MPLSALIFAGFFVFFSLLNVSANLTGRVSLARYSKPFLMPTLIALIWTLQTASFTSLDTTSFSLLLVGLFCGWAGDVFLLSDTDVCTLTGLAAFLLGHLCYGLIGMRIIILHGGGPSWGWLITICAAFLYGGFAVARMNKYRREDSLISLRPLVVYLYAGVILWMTACLLQAHFSAPSFATEAALWGGVFFMISDTTLSKQMFFQYSRLRQGMLMCTYLAGQALIALGLLFTASASPILPLG